MKRKIEEIENEICTGHKDRKMTRKEAIKKSGFLTISAATMLILLSNPKKTQAQETSPAPLPPGW